MCSGWLECCFADAFTKACFRDTWMLWCWGFRRRMMYQPHVEAKVNKQISSYAYFFSLASLSMNNIKDGASFVFLQCWSQLLNNKKIKPKHSMFVETVSLLKHFWKAWKHFEELCTAPEFPSFSSGFLCPFILLTTCNHCHWWCDVGFVPRAISSASSEADNWSACFTTIEHFFGVGSTAISGQHLPNPVE